jgi:hypothetical protein
VREYPGPDEERQKLFRRMEWLYVYVPPLLALLIGVGGALILAAVVPIPGTTFLGRWVLGVLILLVLPTVLYVVWSYVKR